MDSESYSDRIESLRAEADRCKTDIEKHLTTQYNPISISTGKEDEVDGSAASTIALLDFRKDPRLAVQMLQAEVAEVLKETGIKAEVMARTAPMLAECEKLVQLVADISVASHKVEEFEDLITGVHLQKCVEASVEMDAAMGRLPGPNAPFGDGEVYNALRREAGYLKSRFGTRLRRLFLECVVVEKGRIMSQRVLKGMLRDEGQLLDAPILRSSIIDCLLSSGRAKSVLTEFAQSLWTDVLRHLWREKKLANPRIYNSVADADFAEFSYDAIAKDYGHGTSGSSNTAAPSTDSLIGACKLPFSQLLDHVAHVLSFVYSDVLGGSEEAVRVTSDALNDSNGSIQLVAQLKHTLISLIPKSEADLAAFIKAVEKPCADFEAKMVGLGWITPSPPAPSSGDNKAESSSAAASIGPLTSIVNDLTAKFSDARRTEVLARARACVLADYHNAMTTACGDASEDDPASAGDIGDPAALLDGASASIRVGALRFESCQISLAACRVLRLTHEAARAATQCTRPEVASMWYNTARDCIELFMAVAPAKYGDAIATVPRMAAMFYNDCIYMSHNCTLMTHLYRGEYKKANVSFADSVAFIDFIPRLRTLGETALSAVLEGQKRSLFELIDRAKIKCGDSGSNSSESSGNTKASAAGPTTATISAVSSFLSAALSANTSLPSAINAGIGASPEDAVYNDWTASQLVVSHLDKLKGQWGSVLQETVYVKLISYLIESCISRVMKPVLEADFISEKCAAGVSRVLKTLRESKSTLQDHLSGIAASSHNSNAGIDAIVVKSVPSWSKFVTLADLLEYRLSDIAEALPKRKFTSFTGAELTSLIRALFEESPRRAAIIATIADIEASTRPANAQQSGAPSSSS